MVCDASKTLEIATKIKTSSAFGRHDKQSYIPKLQIIFVSITLVVSN